MKHILCAAVVVMLAVPIPAQPPDEKAVRDTIDGFLARLGDGKYETLDADLAPKALIVVVRESDGRWVTTYQTGVEWLAALKTSQSRQPFREPIENVKITLDSERLAYVRADFKVIRNQQTLAHGVDQFTLVKTADGWKIATIAYTSIRAE